MGEGVIWTLFFEDPSITNGSHRSLKIGAAKPRN